ncbi:hypothetical protein B0H19DRAFT_1272015 [Mycena capillaripes]|nr:hypothetical protein B0H19DRAFT_1272015 [Mycena capillaripes]
MASKKRKRRPPKSSAPSTSTSESNIVPTSAPAKKQKRTNQYLPCPDAEDLIPWVEYYWKLGFNDKDIASNCLDHFDRTSFGLSAKSVQRLRQTLDLKGVRQQAASFEMITPFYLEIRERFPMMGARAMVALLRQDYSIKVAEAFLNKFFLQVEPAAVKERRAFKFKRKTFYSAGVMDIICFDQHDKWKKFGLWFHLGIEPHAGQILWCKIWWSNRNGKLITSYYINACRRAGGIPLVTQSDLGSENNGIANCHTVTRQRLDPSLANTLQHRWKPKKGSNIKPEATWSQMRRNFTPGFETTLEKGVNAGDYDVNNPLENLVFRWLAIPWLQAELDAWVSRWNSTPRRHDKNKILPHGIPDLIVAKPHLYETQDFKAKCFVIVPPELFDEMEAQWAPQDDPVFQLTPPVFTAKIRAIYESFDSPPVTSDNFWDLYRSLLTAITPIQDELSDAIENYENGFDCQIELIPNQKPLREGVDVVAGYENCGGVPNFPLPGSSESQDQGDESDEDHRAFADLTDSESS